MNRGLLYLCILKSSSGKMRRTAKGIEEIGFKRIRTFRSWIDWILGMFSGVSQIFTQNISLLIEGRFYNSVCCS